MRIALEPSPPRSRQVLSIALITMVAIFLALLLKGGSPLKVILAFAICASPLLAYLALVRPLLFPYGLYVLLIPFDNLLSVGHVGTLTRFLGIVSGAALLVWCLRTRSVVMPRWSLVIILALLVWSFASALWSIDQGLVLDSLPTYGGLILLYAALSSTPITLRQFQFLLGTVAVSGIGAAAWGANMFFHDPSLTNQDLIARRLLVKVGGSGIDPNQFADALLFPAAILLMYALTTPRLFNKISAFVGILIITVAISLSGSREAAIGLAIIVAYYIVRSRHRLLLIGISAVTFLIVNSFQTSLWVRFSQVSSPRTSIWAVGFEAFKHQWLAGYGLGTFQEAYDYYYISVPQLYSNGWTSPAHNIFIHYMVELGSIGLLLLLAFFVQQFRELRIIRRDSSLYDLRIMMEAAMISVLVAGIFIDLFNYKWAWLVFAMMAQIRNVALSRRSSPNAQEVNVLPPAAMTSQPLRARV